MTVVIVTQRLAGEGHRTAWHIRVLKGYFLYFRFCIIEILLLYYSLLVSELEISCNHRPTSTTSSTT